MLTACALLSCATSAPAQKPAETQSRPASQAPAPSGDSAAKERAKALVQGSSGSGSQAAPASQGGQAAAPATSASTPTPSADQPAAAQAQLTPEESAFLQNYLARLNYMVYYKEDSSIDPRLAKIAVSQANRYLIEKQGLSVIDFDQVEKNKKDQQAAYQAETGGSIDLIQYIAQKFNADVYVEIDFQVTSETRDGKYYASAQGTMKIFDTSTAALLGSVAFMSQPAFSPNSMDAAVTNAIAASVWTAMPRMTGQAQELIKNSLARGVRYELVLQKTPDAKQVSQLRRSLSKKLREVEQVSYSPAEAKFYLYSFQPRDKVEDAVYDAAASAGLPDLYLLFMRGKSFTFNSGL
jgi:hypothetical protein